MSIRDEIYECIDIFDRNNSWLKELVENKTDQELDDILGEYFFTFVYDILINFEVLQMLISRVDVYDTDESGRKSLMTNDELKDYIAKYLDMSFSNFIEDKKSLPYN